MNKFMKRTLLASTVLGVVGIGPVQADLFATAYTDLTNFVIKGSNGNVLDANTDFNTLAFTGSADYDGSLSGAGSFGLNVPNGTQIDFPSACLSSTGDCNPVAENAFPFKTGAQGVDYVAADQREKGAPIANLPGFTQTGAEIGQGAWGSLSNTAAAGSANANNGLEANWTFSLAQATGVTFVGNFKTYLEAFAGAGEQFPGKASASTEFNITITDVQGASGGGIIFSFNPVAMNQTASANANGFLFDIQLCGFLPCGAETAGAFSAPSIALAANNLYQLSMRMNANIDIARVQVPEPGILGMLGLGLLGSIFAARRRRV